MIDEDYTSRLEAMPPFRAACAAGDDRFAGDWQALVDHCLAEIGPTDGATLGFLYLTDMLVPRAEAILNAIRLKTGIEDWIGTVGIGVCANGQAVFDRPGLSLMITHLPRAAYRAIPALTERIDPALQAAGDWLSSPGSSLAIVHADPHNQLASELINRLAEQADTFLVGGLTASRGAFPQFIASDPANGFDTGTVSDQCLGGVFLASDVSLATGHSQGCTPIGPSRLITAAEGDTIHEIDGSPALNWFKEDIGPELASNLRGVAGLIFVGLPVPGSDTGDYLARDLVAIDPRSGALIVAEKVRNGDQIRFLRRDRDSAETDLKRMLDSLKKRCGTSRVKGALYFSCIARGPSLFGEADRELTLIREVFGDIPLTGFFASGEISHNRLYGYTGVLTIFT